MTDLNVHFSSNKLDWGTPRYVFDAVNRIHNFTLDVAADESNALCESFINAEDDCLSQDWIGDICWMNPPYGRGIVKFMKKAYEQSLLGVKVCCLVPARTDTEWWHEYAMKGDIYFYRGRIKFVGAESSAPFPSSLVSFGAPHGLTTDTQGY